MKNIIPKSQLFPKNFTLLKLSNTLRSLECYCIYTVPNTSSCCNKTYTCTQSACLVCQSFNHSELLFPKTQSNIRVFKITVQCFLSVNFLTDQNKWDLWILNGVSHKVDFFFGIFLWMDFLILITNLSLNMSIIFSLIELYKSQLW